MRCEFCFETSDVMIRLFTNGPVQSFHPPAILYILMIPVEWSEGDGGQDDMLVDTIRAVDSDLAGSCSTQILSHILPVQSKVQSLKAWPGKLIISSSLFRTNLMVSGVILSVVRFCLQSSLPSIVPRPKTWQAS